MIPAINSCAFLIPYMVLGSPFLYRVLLAAHLLLVMYSFGVACGGNLPVGLVVSVALKILTR